MEHDLAIELAATAHAELVAMQAQTEPVTGWHAYAGLPIGVLHGLSPGTDLDVAIAEVLEESTDLAVADRVAWLHAGRTGRSHVVLAATTGYLVASLSVELDWAAAMRMEARSYAPGIVSIANAEGVLPVLTLIGS